MLLSLDILAKLVYLFTLHLRVIWSARQKRVNGERRYEKMNHFCPSFNMLCFNWQTLNVYAYFILTSPSFLLAFMKIASPFFHIHPGSFKPSVIKIIKELLYIFSSLLCFLCVVLF